jgi:ADP-dependent NAD(P)H-hydrate dehydratase / NAD(P)H-hydrate epimerase
MRIALQNDIDSIERKVLEDLKVPMLLLMEQAGAAVAKHAWSWLQGSNRMNRVIMVCGTGNNGGDGLAAARHLAAAGADIRVYMHGDLKNATELTKIYANIIERMGLKIRNLHAAHALSSFSAELAECDLIVDALMGIGYKPPMRAEISRIIQAMNQSRVPVLAIDLPSGVECDTGQAETAVCAVQTITLILPKPGHYLQPGASLSGCIVTENLAIPNDLAGAETSIEAIDESMAASIIKSRHPNSHKGDMGRTVIVAGSARYPGAALLAARGAIRSGAGLVHLLDYGKQDTTMYMPEIIPAKNLSPKDEMTDCDHIMKVLANISNPSVLVMGPGLSDDPRIKEAVLHAIRKWEGALVLDADALNFLHNPAGLLPNISGPVVITPHPGEMARLMGISTMEVQRDRVRIAREAAEMWNCTVVLKGAGTVVADKGQRSYINTTGNPGMAAGGSGDILTGLIGGLISQGYESPTAAVLGVYMHGKAGDLAAAKYGPVGFTPSETADLLPAVYQYIFGIKNEGKEHLHAEENTEVQDKRGKLYE